MIALEPGGVSWTTERFAEQIENRMTYGARTVTFAIGGADGLPSALVRRAKLRLSLSALTFPHRIARLVLAGTDLQSPDNHPRRALSPLTIGRC